MARRVFLVAPALAVALAVVLCGASSGAWLSASSVSAASSAAQAAPLAAPPAQDERSVPPLPYVEQGVCPFECCQYRDWRASRPMTAHDGWDDPRLTARRKTVFGIARGDTITAMTGLVMTTKAGRLRINKDATLTSVPSRFPKQPPEKVSAHAGDVLYLLVPHGEGVYTIWYDGRLLESVDVSDLMVAAVGQTVGAPPKDVLEQPVYEWWVRVRNQQGEVGWTDRARDFTGADACSNALPSR
jgi:SH3-like domain-containing protein